MRFLRLHLTHYRGVPASDVHFAENGVTIVEGPNEIGKSSLVEAVRLLFDYKDSSQAKAVLAIQPVGEDVGTTIELTFRTGPHELVYAKTFNRNRKTTLRVITPAKRSLTGRRAHEHVRQILAQTVDEALWRALRTEQGSGLRPAQGLADAPSLAAALDRAAGQVPSSAASGGEAEESLFAAARREFDRYFTPTGRDGKPLVSSASDVLRNRERSDEARDRLEALEAETVRLEQIERDLREARAALPADERALEAAIERKETLAAERQSLAELRLHWKNAKLEADGAIDRLEARTRLRDEVRRQRSEIEDFVARRTADEPVWEELEQALATAETNRARAKDALEATRVIEEATVAIRRRIELDDEIARATTRRERIVAALAAAADAEKLLARGQIDAELVESLRESARAIETLRERLEASRTEVRIEALGPITPTIGTSDTPLEPGDKRSIRVSRELRIHLPGVADLLIRAADTDAELETRIVNAERARDELLAAVGVASIDEAAASLAELESATQLVAERDRTLEEWLEEPDLAALEADLAEKRAERSGLDDEVSWPGPGDEPAALAGARRAEESARRKRRDAEETFEAALSAVQRERERENALLRAREQHDAALTERRGTIAMRENELAAARSDVADDELNRIVSEAIACRAEREIELTAAECSAGDDVFDAVRAAEEEARVRGDRRRAEIGRLESGRIEVRTRLAERGDQGWREQLDDAETSLHRAVSARDRLCTRAAAAHHLYRTLEGERERARASYAGPLQARIRELGRPLWGDAFSVEVDESLEVVARTIGDRVLPFEALSGGAREQLVLLTRLAAAQIVAEDDDGVPLLLDDALGASDPERLTAIGDAISEAGKSCQVIVLTCDPRRFAGVRGASFVRLGTDTTAVQ